MDQVKATATVGIGTAALLSAPSLGPAPARDPGPPITLPASPDLTGDGFIDGADLGALLDAWGTTGADLGSDGTTDGADLGVMLSMWSPDHLVRDAAVIDAHHGSPVPVPAGAFRDRLDRYGPAWEGRVRMAWGLCLAYGPPEHASAGQ